MPWARIAPNLAMTSSCLSLMTLEYSCLNWFTWRNKKKNYSLVLFTCCVIFERGIDCSNETWVLIHNIQKERDLDRIWRENNPMIEIMDVMTFLVWEHQLCFQSSFHSGWFRLRGMLSVISYCTTYCTILHIAPLLVSKLKQLKGTLRLSVSFELHLFCSPSTYRFPNGHH